MKKIAAYSGTRNLYPDMVPAYKSLLLNSDVDKVYLLIEDDEFPFELPPEVETMNMSDQTLFPWDGPNIKSPYTYMVLMRGAYSKIFPQYDRILSLDVDTIVDADISELWDLPIDEYYMSATPQRPPWPANGYVNVGVTLFNLKKLRDGTDDEVIHLLNTLYMRWVEQDALNHVCRGKIYPMPARYNHNEFVNREPEPKIHHFAAIANWSGSRFVEKYRDIPLDEIKRVRAERYGK